MSEDDILDARILIVDDQQANVQLLEQLLQEVGYRQVSSTLDPQAVCPLHRANRYDLILLDLQMPGMDGFEVMAGLKEIESDGYAPILAITAQPDHKLRALASGARDFVAKPFDLLEVKTRIHNLLQVRLLYRQLEHSNRALASLALHDPLTCLPNRRLLMDRLKQAMLTSARTGEHGALIFLDLDNFKQLNDTLGHDMGDLLLQQAAARLQACLREGDSVARLGGDEFVILLEALSAHDAEAATQAESIANKILQSFAAGFQLRGQACDSTASVGIVVFLGAHEDQNDLINKADLAMYQAKSAGRNTARFFAPAAQAREALVKDMRRGLAMQEFVLYYQVQVNRQGVPTGAEALVRWKHPQSGLLAPAHFIPLAEESGMILALGQWVLLSACAQLTHWAQRSETAHWTVAVNLSAVQFAQPNFVALVVGALQQTAANPRLLRFEMSAGMLAQDTENAIAKMNAVKAHGVGFSLGDAGIGYASLSYLRRLPLDQLKIDRSFVRDIVTNPSDSVVARTILERRSSLRLKVIAEGVETPRQRDFLARMGCDAFQGYLFGRPVPACALVEHLLH
ncbi:MAG: EAL domain-containing protein [Rhodoferax sp.]|uniref:putative bifunctional diguanylate cyclase/phosphodiesterase n=1 Tax=Rhodoferax sp. TaxID=50421 RepID=UPI00262E4C53|nr:EAL domain-containing protein [Rhodoferax sp.]MDD5335840.1 EAL domain-containing protein [Rhodoferax sp.]